jgi:hypothetical protein
LLSASIRKLAEVTTLSPLAHLPSPDFHLSPLHDAGQAARWRGYETFPVAFVDDHDLPVAAVDDPRCRGTAMTLLPLPVSISASAIHVGEQEVVGDCGQLDLAHLHGAVWLG